MLGATGGELAGKFRYFHRRLKPSIPRGQQVLAIPRPCSARRGRPPGQVGAGPATLNSTLIRKGNASDLAPARTID